MLHSMKCKCGYHFCWRCLKSWSPTHTDYFRCKGEVSAQCSECSQAFCHIYVQFVVYSVCLLFTAVFVLFSCLLFTVFVYCLQLLFTVFLFVVYSVCLLFTAVFEHCLLFSCFLFTVFVYCLQLCLYCFPVCCVLFKYC